MDLDRKELLPVGGPRSGLHTDEFEGGAREAVFQRDVFLSMLLKRRTGSAVWLPQGRDERVIRGHVRLVELIHEEAHKRDCAGLVVRAGFGRDRV